MKNDIWRDRIRQELKECAQEVIDHADKYIPKSDEVSAIGYVEVTLTPSIRGDEPPKVALHIEMIPDESINRISK